MTLRQALAFIRKHGVVLEAARGKVPSLAEAIVGESLNGSWWPHPRSRDIFAITRAVRESPDVLVCRVIDGKITLVHRRLWPAFVRASHHFPVKVLTQLREVHTPSGKHVTEKCPYPQWVPESVNAEAEHLSEAQALQALSPWLP